MSEKFKILYVVIGCDADPDRPYIIDHVPSDKLSWRGLLEGIPIAKEFIKDIKDADRRPPAFTWLIRADEQIKKIYGDYDWVLREYQQFLGDLEATGDEIGWHPHFYKHNDKHKIWYQELHDHIWQCDMLESAFNSFNRVFPGRPRSARTGWIYHNNHTMKKMEDLGIKVDFSAVPGLRTRSGKNMKFPYNVYDWLITPPEYYYPSASDYRRSAQKGESRLSILEVPNFVSDSFFWGMVAGLQATWKMKNPMQIFQAIKNPRFWVNLTAAPGIFSPIITSLKKKLRKTRESNIFFVTYFHADELIENRSKIYNRGNLRQNLIDIVECCPKLNVAVKFIKAENIPEIVNKSTAELL